MSPPKQTVAVPLDEASLEAFCDLLAARTGLQVRDKDRTEVYGVLVNRCHDLKMSVADYIQSLREQKVDGGEWARLMPTLTNGESYFGRDKGQFSLLKNRVFPDLIARRNMEGERTLRLWSAGCSTGEEAYSLAMVVDSVLPQGWRATVLGTDINTESLQKARRGVYGSWSFRGVDNETRGSFFQPVSGGYQIAATLRQRVRFEFCNLSSFDWPDAARGIADMDLIVCRNVLIYFQRAAVAGVLSRFARTLRSGGYLVTGHAELHDQNVAPLRAKLFPESAVYQKDNTSSVAIPSGAIPSGVRKTIELAPLPAPPAPARPINSTPRASTLGARTPPVQSLPSAPVKTAPDRVTDELFQKARQLADSGRYDEALDCCHDAIKADGTHADAYLLCAQIAEEQGRSADAKELLKKVIYLAPGRVEAYVELAAIYEHEGDAARARQMRVSALDLLRSGKGPESSKELVSHLEQLLGEGGRR